MSYKEHNQLTELSPNQTNTYAALPSDFPITTPAEAARQALPGHGQRGTSISEYHELLSEADQQRKPQLSDS